MHFTNRHFTTRRFLRLKTNSLLDYRNLSLNRPPQSFSQHGTGEQFFDQPLSNRCVPMEHILAKIRGLLTAENISRNNNRPFNIVWQMKRKTKLGAVKMDVYLMSATTFHRWTEWSPLCAAPIQCCMSSVIRISNEKDSSKRVLAPVINQCCLEILWQRLYVNSTLVTACIYRKIYRKFKRTQRNLKESSVDLNFSIHNVW